MGELVDVTHGEEVRLCVLVHNIKFNLLPY